MESVHVILQRQDTQRNLGLQKSNTVSDDIEHEQVGRTRDRSLSFPGVDVLRASGSQDARCRIVRPLEPGNGCKERSEARAGGIQRMRTR